MVLAQGRLMVPKLEFRLCAFLYKYSVTKGRAIAATADREREHFSACGPLDAIYLVNCRDLGREGCNARDLSETIL